MTTSNESNLSNLNSSSSVDSMISYGGCGIISWQSNNASSVEFPLDRSLAPFKVERSSSIGSNTGRRKQHEAMMDVRQHRKKLNENNNIEVAVRDSKRQKTGVQEEKLPCFTSFESFFSSSRIMTAQETLKASVKKSQKLGDKITALQQLVSPFGKADTASVLHEAAVYINTLHEQIKLLSKPYVELISSPERIQCTKNGGEKYHHKSSCLSGERLCMVPISPSIRGLANQELFDGSMKNTIN